MLVHYATKARKRAPTLKINIGIVLVSELLRLELYSDRGAWVLCRTGARSVRAANLLVAAGYANVRNIWKGFVGQYKADASGNTPLDLNNDGVINDMDKDGWR